MLRRNNALHEANNTDAYHKDGHLFLSPEGKATGAGAGGGVGGGRHRSPSTTSSTTACNSIVSGGGGKQHLASVAQTQYQSQHQNLTTVIVSPKSQDLSSPFKGSSRRASVLLAQGDASKQNRWADS